MNPYTKSTVNMTLKNSCDILAKWLNFINDTGDINQLPPREAVLAVKFIHDCGVNDIAALAQDLHMPSVVFYRYLRLANTSLVYFIQGADKIKIGFTAQIERRMDTLQASSPVELNLLATAIGDKEHEAYLHRKFWHLRSHGEWFFATDELLEYIEEVKNAEQYS